MSTLIDNITSTFEIIQSDNQHVKRVNVVNSIVD